jgi:hypothetical protein
MSQFATRFGIVEIEDFEIFSDLIFAMDKEYFAVKETLNPTKEGR